MSYLPAELDDDFSYEDAFLADSGDGGVEFFHTQEPNNLVGHELKLQHQHGQQSETAHDHLHHGYNYNHTKQSFPQGFNGVQKAGQDMKEKSSSREHNKNQNGSQAVNSWKGPSSSSTSSPLLSSSAFTSSSFATPSPPTVLTEEDLKVATVKGHVTTVRNCLQQGLLINDVLLNGWTPLMYACNHSKSRVVELLLQEGADPSYHVDLYTPLMCACSTSASTTERLECVKMLIEAGTDVNARDRHHTTGLMLASRLGYLDLVEFLIQKGAKVNEQDSRGWTALTWSVQRGHKDVALALLEAGADCNIKHADRLTVKDVAAHMPTDEMLALLERRPVITSSGGGDMTGTGIEGGVFSKEDQAFPSSSSSSFQHSIQADDGDGGARSTDLRYGEMEIFLLGLDLPHLVPLFHKHLIDLFLLLDMTEQDLINAGVEQVGARKKILDASQAVHKKNWEGSSLVSVHFNKQICCSDAVAMVANVSKHIRYINSTVLYIRQHLKHHPQSVIHATDRASPTQLVRHIVDTSKHVQTLQAELNSLHQTLLQEMKSVNVNPPDLISRSNDEADVEPSTKTVIRRGRIRSVGVVVTCGLVVTASLGVGYLWRTGRLADCLHNTLIGDRFYKVL